VADAVSHTAEDRWRQKTGKKTGEIEQAEECRIDNPENGVDLFL
jgi:hypothetical protein